MNRLLSYRRMMGVLLWIGGAQVMNAQNATQRPWQPYLEQLSEMEDYESVAWEDYEAVLEEYAEHPFHVYTVEEYIDVIVKYIRLLRKDLVLERFVSQSPKELLIAPKWGLKNYEFTNLLNNRLKSLQ